MATDNRVIVLVGGFDNNGEEIPLADTHVYSMKKRSWVRGPNLISSRFQACCSTLGGFTYVFHGTGKLMSCPNARDGHLTTIERLNNKTLKAWENITTPGFNPVPRTPCFAIGLSDNEVLVCGMNNFRGSYIMEVLRIDK